MQTAEARYVGIIRGIILAHLAVPQSLRNLGASGLAMVAFKVTPNGRIVRVRVMRRGSYAAANRAARTAVQTSILPAFFKPMPQHAIVFAIPIHVNGDA